MTNQIPTPNRRERVYSCPLPLEKGIRGQQALKLVLAEMYVQGVSTRNEASLLRLVIALLAETSEECDTGKAYLNMENQTQPSA